MLKTWTWCIFPAILHALIGKVLLLFFCQDSHLSFRRTEYCDLFWHIFPKTLSLTCLRNALNTPSPPPYADMSPRSHRHRKKKPWTTKRDIFCCFKQARGIPKLGKCLYGNQIRRQNCMAYQRKESNSILVSADWCVCDCAFVAGTWPERISTARDPVSDNWPGIVRGGLMLLIRLVLDSNSRNSDIPYTNPIIPMGMYAPRTFHPMV